MCIRDSGTTAAVLKYRMPNGHCEVPRNDAEQALRIMREHAAESVSYTHLDVYKRQFHYLRLRSGGNRTSKNRTVLAFTRGFFRIFGYALDISSRHNKT